MCVAAVVCYGCQTSSQAGVLLFSDVISLRTPSWVIAFGGSAKLLLTTTVGQSWRCGGKHYLSSDSHGPHICVSFLDFQLQASDSTLCSLYQASSVFDIKMIPHSLWVSSDDC